MTVTFVHQHPKEVPLETVGLLVQRRVEKGVLLKIRVGEANCCFQGQRHKTASKAACSRTSFIHRAEQGVATIEARPLPLRKTH